MKAQAFKQKWVHEKNYDNYNWVSILGSVRGRMNIDKAKLDTFYQKLLEDQNLIEIQIEVYFEPFQDNVLEAVLNIKLIWNNNDWEIKEVLVINPDPFGDLNDPDYEGEELLTMNDILK